MISRQAVCQLSKCASGCKAKSLSVKVPGDQGRNCHGHRGSNIGFYLHAFWFYIQSSFQVFRFSEKNDRENTLLTRTDRKTMTQAFTSERIFKPLFQFSSSVQHPGQTDVAFLTSKSEGYFSRYSPQLGHDQLFLSSFYETGKFTNVA